MNDLLTPLAVLGLILFGALIVLIAIFFIQQAFGVARLLRGSGTTVRFTWGTKPLDSPARQLESEDEPTAQDKSPESPSDPSSGWGFDSR